MHDIAHRLHRQMGVRLAQLCASVKDAKCAILGYPSKVYSASRELAL